MKDQEGNASCLAVFLFWVVFIGGGMLLQNYSRSTDHKVTTPVPTRTAAPVYRGPSPDDCRRETDERRANACWEYIDDWYSSRQEMEMERDYYQDDPSYDDPEYYDPFEDGRFVDGP